MKTKTALVTGANAGIGKEIARGLARQGMRVIIACHDYAKAPAARDSIVLTTGNESIATEHLDLASLLPMASNGTSASTTWGHSFSPPCSSTC